MLNSVADVSLRYRLLLMLGCRHLQWFQQQTVARLQSGASMIALSLLSCRQLMMALLRMHLSFPALLHSSLLEQTTRCVSGNLIGLEDSRDYCARGQGMGRHRR